MGEGSGGEKVREVDYHERQRLRAHDVVVRELPGRNLIRVSCGYWTSEQDIERLLAGLA